MAEESNQKKHWDDELRRQEEEFAKLLQAQERVEGILYLCSLDLVLEQLLRAVMIDSKSVDELMKDGQALQPFSSKLRLAYALGLIPEALRKDLYYLNKIRNEFAHNGEIKSFDEAPICDLCSNLSMVKQGDGTSLSPRRAFAATAAASARFLLKESARRLTDKMLHQSQQADFVDSRYASYFNKRNEPTK